MALLLTYIDTRKTQATGKGIKKLIIETHTRKKTTINNGKYRTSVNGIDNKNDQQGHDYASDVEYEDYSDDDEND